jgi:hypothetical protein
LQFYDFFCIITTTSNISEFLMSDYKIPNRSISTLNYETDIHRSDNSAIIQSPRQNVKKSLANQFPVDYSNVPVSHSVSRHGQETPQFQLDDLQIDALIKNVLNEKASPVPNAYHTQSQHNDMQASVIAHLQNQQHPIPRALR